MTLIVTLKIDSSVVECGPMKQEVPVPFQVRARTPNVPLGSTPSVIQPTRAPRPGVLDMLDAMFQFLNKSSPEMTKDCWLCLNPEPPYYTGIGANRSLGGESTDIRNYSVDSTPPGLCQWGQHPKLSLEDLQGEGTCLFPANYHLQSSPYSSSCSMTIELPQEGEESLIRYLVAPEGTWWACSNGITPCAFPLALQDKENPGICILTHILPQVYYYSGEGVREHLRLEPRRSKRAQVLVPLLIGLGIAGSTVVGPATLTTGHQSYQELSKQI